MIFSNTTKKSISVISMFMVMIMGFATAFAPVSTYAAEDDGYGVGDKVKLVHDHQIRYGSGDGGYSNLMEAHGIDDSLGNRPVFCTQPNMPTHSAATYTIDKMYTSDSGKADVLRKLVYYAKGYPGWSWARTSGSQAAVGPVMISTASSTLQYPMLKPTTTTAWLHGAAAQSKADGTSNTVEVSAGTYTLKEDVCPKGYAKAADRTVTVKAGATTEVVISDMPQSDPISILLQKVDRETGNRKAAS